MKTLHVIYWSQTGNTAAMAQAIAQGAQETGAQVKLLEVDQATPEDALSCDLLALGCPAMGSEVLEEGEFEPFYAGIEGMLSGRRVALFGSYGWGDGQWMRDWYERAEAAGLDLYAGEGLTVNETPDEAALERCRAFGAGFVSG